MSDLNENKINSEETIPQSNQEKPQKKLSAIIDYVELFVIAISVVILLFSFVFRTCNVDGDSMNNTLIDKETLIISDFAYTPRRGDIIVFHQTGYKNMPLVKRVIGVGGDTVTVNVDTWEVSVTDKGGNTFVLDEPYIHVDEYRTHNLIRKTGESVHTFVVPEGTVFVLGDNRNNSMDSTDSNVGFVSEDVILGKVLLRVSPIAKFGTVD